MLGCSSHGVCENFECSCQSGWAPPDCSLSKKNTSMLHFYMYFVDAASFYLACFVIARVLFFGSLPKTIINDIHSSYFSVCNFMSTTNSVDEKIIAGTTCDGLKCVNGKCYNGHCYCDLVRNTENLVVFYSFAINFVRTGEMGAPTYCDLYHTYRNS